MPFELLRWTSRLTLCAVAALAAHAARAADLIAKPAVEVAADDASWTGLHVGVGAGGSSFSSNWTTDCLAPAALPAGCPNDIFGGATRIGNDNPASFDSSSARLNAYLGLDWQASHRLVLGIEGEAAWIDAENTRSGIPGTWSADFGAGLNSAWIENSWEASLRVRAGFLLTPKTLVYSTGGLALLHQEVGASCEGAFPVGWCNAPNSDSDSAITVGWTAGGGVERMLGRNWIVRGEYRYSDFGKRSFTLFDDAPLDSIAVTVKQRMSTAYVGISRQF